MATSGDARPAHVRFIPEVLLVRNKLDRRISDPAYQQAQARNADFLRARPPYPRLARAPLPDRADRQA